MKHPLGSGSYHPLSRCFATLPLLYFIESPPGCDCLNFLNLDRKAMPSRFLILDFDRRSPMNSSHACNGLEATLLTTGLKPPRPY
jgi:hypothetical protein